jgi:hypothetical protein
MSKLTAVTQGVKGGNTKGGKVGYANITMGVFEDRVTFDAYEGQGNTYKEREMINISVYHNGELIWMGDKYELYEKLRS